MARESPELALLSLLASRDDDLATALRVAQAAELAFRDLPEEQGSLYFDAGRREMADAVRRALEENMGPGRKYEYQSDFARRYVAEGRAEGREEGQRLLLSRLLGARFGPLPAWAMARLDSAEGAELERLSERLLSAATLEDALGPEQSDE